jgi:hypothetical protein
MPVWACVVLLIQRIMGSVEDHAVHVVVVNENIIITIIILKFFSKIQIMLTRLDLLGLKNALIKIYLKSK